jgi:hypothetical protein
MSGALPEPDVSAPTLLPASDDQLSADDAFQRYEDSLVEGGITADDLVVTTEEPVPFGKGIALDVQRRRLIGTPAGHGVLVTYDEATFRTWIAKALVTARGAHPIYSSSFGVERPHELFGGPIEQFPEGEAIARWTEALLRHPRITDVTDWEIDTATLGDEEVVLVDFTVEIDSADTLNLTSLAVSI